MGFKTLAAAILLGFSMYVYPQARTPDPGVLNSILKNYYINITVPKEIVLADKKKYSVNKDFYFKAEADTNHLKTLFSKGLFIMKETYSDSVAAKLTKDNDGYLFMKYDSKLIAEQLAVKIHDSFVPKNKAVLDDKPIFLEDIVRVYPNPFNNSTKVVLDVPYHSDVGLSVLNSIGQKVIGFETERLDKGRSFKSIDLSGLSSGVYFLFIDGKSSKREYMSVQKLLLVK